MLTKKQFDILEAYVSHTTSGETGSLTQREVAELTNQSLGNTNRLIKELTASGLLANGSITSAGWDSLEPYRVKRAVFLAAGFGHRLIPVTLNTPKPLVRVKGKRIIDGLLDQVIALGITEIYIVRGYLGEQFDQLLKTYPTIQFLENPIYNESNNISSAMCARYLLSNCYVFEADLILRPGLLKRYHYTSDFLATYGERVDDWCFKASNGMITDELLGDYDAWRNCGVSYWNEQDGKRLAEHLKSAYEAPGGKELYWEQVPLHVYRGSYQVEIIPCDEQDVTEIDTYKELKSADSNYGL